MVALEEVFNSFRHEAISPCALGEWRHNSESKQAQINFASVGTRNAVRKRVSSPNKSPASRKAGLT
jgi:hypothetical protein